MNPSERETVSHDDFYEQACQEVDRLKDLIPHVETQHRRLGVVLSRTHHVLKERILQSQRFFEDAVRFLKLSSADIRCLDEETCRNLLRTTRELVPRMKLLSAARSGKQPWLRSIIHLKESCHSLNPSGEVLMEHWYDHLTLQLKYMAEWYLTVLFDGRQRLMELAHKDKVKLAQLQPLKNVLEKSMNLLVLSRADIPRVDKKECCKLVKMTKLFVMGALIRNYARGDTKQVWPCENLIAISEVLQQLNLNSESDQVGPALKFRAESSGYRSGGLSEGDWHHQAYEELQTIRIMHSSTLDEAYIKGYGGVLCPLLARTCVKFLKKSLAFLATSRTEFASLSKEKCYYRMLLVKLFVFLTKGSVSAYQNFLQSQAAGSPPNWRDWVYEEIRGMRTKYSSELDKEAYRRVMCTHNPELLKDPKACSNVILEESLDFLGYDRADLSLVSMVDCLDRLARVMRYLKCWRKFDCAEAYEKSIESCSYSTYQIPPESNWRDEVYEEIKSKKVKFLYEFDVPYQEVHKKKFQLPTEATKLKELEHSLDRAFRFFTMRRYEIALLSEKEYDESVVSVIQDLVNVRDILTSLRKNMGKRGGYPSDISRILPKRRV